MKSTDRMEDHLEDTEDLAIGNENAREQLQEIQDTMEKTMEALTALSTGLEKQQVRMNKRKVQIADQNDEIDEHQAQIKKANERLQRHQDVVNKAAKDNAVQAVKIRANVANLIKQERIIENIAAEQGQQAALMAKHGLKMASDSTSKLQNAQNSAKSMSKKMATDHVAEVKGIDRESERSTRLEANERILMTQARTEKAEIDKEGQEIEKEEKHLKDVRQKAQDEHRMYFMLLIGINILLIVIIAASTARWQKINKEATEAKKSS